MAVGTVPIEVALRVDLSDGAKVAWRDNLRDPSLAGRRAISKAACWAMRAGRAMDREKGNRSAERLALGLGKEWAVWRGKMKDKS
jgi:hypothetical protein